MSDLIFATPWWLLGGLVLVGIALLVAGNSRQQAGVRNAGGALLLLAIVLATVSYLVETDKERVTRLTRELVQSVPSRDWVKMTELLDADASLRTAEITLFPNRKALVDGAKAAAERYQLGSVGITSLSPTQDNTGDVTVDLDVVTVQEASMGRPVQSSWRFAWGGEGKSWHCHLITCLKIGDQNIGQVLGK